MENHVSDELNTAEVAEGDAGNLPDSTKNVEGGEADTEIAEALENAGVEHFDALGEKEQETIAAIAREGAAEAGMNIMEWLNLKTGFKKAVQAVVFAAVLIAGSAGAYGQTYHGPDGREAGQRQTVEHQVSPQVHGVGPAVVIGSDGNPTISVPANVAPDSSDSHRDALGGLRFHDEN